MGERLSKFRFQGWCEACRCENHATFHSARSLTMKIVINDKFADGVFNLMLMFKEFLRGLYASELFE